jgi:hypothetical protein
VSGVIRLDPLPPSVVVEFQIECVAPTVRLCCSTYEDELALRAWLDLHPDVFCDLCDFDGLLVAA